MTENAPQFDAGFRNGLERLFRWRRDVRHFRRDPVAPEMLAALIGQACLAPSVGFCQPWRFVSVEDPKRRAAVRENFLSCNQAALADYDGAKAKLCRAWRNTRIRTCNERDFYTSAACGFRSSRSG